MNKIKRDEQKKKLEEDALYYSKIMIQLFFHGFFFF